MPSACTAARCSSDCGIQPSSAATVNSTAGTGPTPASMLGTKRSCPGTSTNASRSPDGSVSQQNPRSMVRPRRRSSAHRSGSIPVSARTRVDLPWSTCPAVAITCMVPGSPAASTAPASRSSWLGGTARRSSSSRPPSVRPTTAGNWPLRTGWPARSARGQPGRQADRRAGQRHARGTAPADHGRAGGRPGIQPGRGQPAGQLPGPPGQRRLIGGQRHGQRDRRPGQRGFQRRGRRLVHPQRPGQRMPGQLADQGGLAEDQAGLRPAEQLVPARGDQRGARLQPRPGIRLVGQQRVPAEQPGPDVGQHRDAQRGQLGHAGLGGEALDAEVRRVHFQHEPGARAAGPCVVGQRGAVGRADLADPGPGGLHQLGQPEPVADLDHLAPADHDLPAGRQRGRRQHQRGRVVVHHVHGFRGGHRGGQRGQRAAAPAAPGARVQVEFQVGVAGRGRHRGHRRGGQRGPAEVGVQQHAGRVQHREQRGGRAGQPGHRHVSHRVRADLPGPGLLLGAGHRLLDPGPAEPADGLAQPRIGQHRVGTRHKPAAIHDGEITPTRVGHFMVHNPRTGG